MFLYAFEEIFDEYPNKVLSLLNSNLPFFELIRQWVGLYYDLNLKYPELLFVRFNKADKDLRRTSREYMNIFPPFGDKTMHYVYQQLSKLLKKEIAKGTIHPISASDFMLNCLSLMGFPFLGDFIAKQFMNLSDEEYIKTIHKRRDYVADAIINMIKK